MIWRPKKNRKVKLRYIPSMRPETGLNGVIGRVVAVGTWKGPLNALVKVGGGRKIVVPRWNLFLRGE